MRPRTRPEAGRSLRTPAPAKRTEGRHAPPGRTALPLLLAAALAPLPAAASPARSSPGHLGLVSALPTPGAEPPGFHLGDPSDVFAAGPPPGSHLLRRDVLGPPRPAAPPDVAVAGGLDLAAVPGRPARPDRSAMVAGGFTALFLGLEYAAFWSSENLSGGFQVANEGWFGQESYAGGADKASHVVGGYLAGRVLEGALRWGGSPPAKSQLLSAAMIAVTGTLIEVGDAYHGYGFSWEDALLTAAGGVAGSVLASTGWDDTVTMRFGKVGVDLPDDPSVVAFEPNHYSGEVYTLDLRLAGLLPRMGKRPGLARFVLGSLTYGSKGYKWVDERYRQRRVGFEVGLDTYEVGLALGLKPDSWWGAPILAFLRYFRIPYTGIGWQYELNSGRWMGPNSFHSYDR